MYFSRNSRYVLQRVRFLSPKFLSSSKKNLSVKKPKDDPTKPPLRINIPEDITQSEDYAKFPQNPSKVGEPRSKSLITRSKSTPFSSSFENNTLAKSESEIQFSQLPVKNILERSNYDNEAELSSKTFQTSNVHGKNQNNKDNDKGSSVKDDATENVLAEKCAANAASNDENYKSNPNASKHKSFEVPAGRQTKGNTSQKSLYIIIDVAQRGLEDKENEEKSTILSDPNNRKESKSFFNRARPSFSSTRENQEKDDQNLLKRSKSFSKFSFDNKKLKVSKKFEVHEIEDAATYIFHVKFNPNSWRKPCGVGWVPEKEISTRNENPSFDESSIRTRRPFGSGINDLGREMTFPNQLPQLRKLVKLSEDSRKLIARETEGKPNLLSMDKKSTYEEPQAEAQAEASHGRAVTNEEQVSAILEPKNVIEKVSYIKEERKSPQEFVRDDYGTVRTASKTYPFRIPIKCYEGKPEVTSPPENSSASPTVSEQEAYAENSSNPAAEINEMPKVESNSAAVSKVNITQQEPTDQLPSYAESVKSATTDSYAQYIGKRQKALKAEKSDENSRKTSEYLNIYEEKPNLNQTSVENRQYSNHSQYSGTNERVPVTNQSPTGGNQNSEKLQYFNPREKPAPALPDISTGITKNKSDSESYNAPKRLPSTKTKKTTKNPQNIKTPKKKLTDMAYQDKLNSSTSKSSEFEKPEDEASDFQTSTSFVSIGCGKIPSNPMTYSAAFPPLLREALNTRLRFRKDFLLNPKWTKIEIRSKDVNNKHSHKYKVSELSENSILFPKKESEKFDCDSLFSNKEEIILNIIKNTEGESSPKIKDNVANFADENLTKNQEEPSVDSLTVMKKVKEIIQLDLDNAVKIFKNDQPESAKELPSVVILKEDSWEVDSEELKRQTELKNDQIKIAGFIDSGLGDGIRLTSDVFGDKIETKLPKYLPPEEKHFTEMKLFGDESDSVMMFNPKTNEFFINKEALANAISRRTGEPLEEVNYTLDLLAESSKKSLNTKSGDSILVFDEETQSWKVDFSILEKREQELQLEKELTKRSELILETFEKLERGQLSSVPKPDSKEKKTFDYATEKWKVYEERTKPKERPTKSKSPFRESNAEEIRRKNSDLYEDLFVVKKKDTAVTKADKSAPGLDSSKSSKESKSGASGEKKEASGEKKEASDSNPAKGSGSSPKGPEPPKSDSKLPPINQKEPIKKEDDNFWESFLKMNILPRDVRELPNPLPPPKPPPPTQPPVPKAPSVIRPKIEEPKSKTPGKKIEEPVLKKPKKKIDDTKLKIPDKKIEESNLKIPDKKIEESKLKIPDKKIEDSKLKVPDKKIEDSKLKIPDKKIEDSKLKIPDKKIEEPVFKIHLPFIRDRKSGPSKSSNSIVPKEEPKVKDEKKAPPPPAEGGSEKKAPPSGVSSEKKDKTEKKAPPPPSTSFPKNDSKKPPTIGSSKPGLPAEKSLPGKTQEKSLPGKTQEKSPPSKTQGSNFPSKGNNEKTASASEHYVSDKIIEMSKNKTKDSQTKIKKIETVKLNLTTDTRLPSKVTEINLNKKCEEKAKELTDTPQNSVVAKKSSDETPIKTEMSLEEKKPLYKNLEKYKTHFSDPDYEEKPMKIKSDLESNPNLKNLENWNKTLVLHDIMKPPDNIENWLKDETDKMATLLLKILQETTDGKSKKKPPLARSKSEDKNPARGNPYENIRKKREVTPENFLFRVRTVNLSLENDKKAKPEEKILLKSEKLKDLPFQSGKNTTASVIEDPEKHMTMEKSALAPATSANIKGSQLPANPTALDTVVYPVLMNRDFSPQNKLPLELTDEIPGPEILKKISNAWKVVPVLGSQMTIFTLFRLFQLVNLGTSIFGNHTPDRNKRSTFSKLFKKYGPIVNVQGPLSGNVILIHKPEHVAAVFEQDGNAPVRSVFDSLEHSRRDLEERMFSVHFSMDWTKPEWNDLRKGMNDTFFKGGEKYLRTAEMAGNSLINNIRKNRNSQNLVSEDFMEEIRRWSLEGLCSVLFEKSFGFLEGRTSNSWIMEPDKLYMAIDEATHCLNKCEKGFQTWRLMGTPSISGLSQAYRALSSIISRQLYQAEIHLKNKNELLKSGVLFPMRELSFIENMLLNDGMTIEEVSCSLIDVLLIGTNAMNSAMGFLLYNLAQNGKIQNKLVKELKEAFPYKSSRVDFNKLNSLKYLPACLKESLRLHMPVPIFYRILQNDILLANYIVPKGTYVIMDYRVSCMREQVFDDPDKFAPERWLTDEKWTHPFSSFPFCHGPKAELAKRVVEMQLLICAAKIIRNFKIEYHFGEIHGTDGLITFPDKPLKLNFIERKS